MNWQSALFRNEARSLLAAWCAVTLAGAISPGWLTPAPWFGRGILNLISSLGFWVGIPLLASLSLGNEFQHRTLDLLLSQPVERMKIWGVKTRTVALAVFSSALVYAVARNLLRQPNRETVVLGALWIIVAVCSCVFWTLVARSTIGGLVLNLMQGAIFLIAVSVPARFSLSYEVLSNSLSVISLVLLPYAALMLWLGRRKFAQFQVASTVAGDDLLLRYPKLMHAVTGWLRPRPKGVVFNLIRKELRLLWPVWFLMILCLTLMLLLAPLQSTAASANPQPLNVPRIAAVLSILYALVSLILLGSIAMGEERTLGTQAWHLSLPVSPTLQWAVKMSVVWMTALAGVVLTSGLGQLLFGRNFTESYFIGGSGEAGWLVVFQLSLVSLAAFWCACGVNGTVRAVLWTVPALAAVTLAFRLAMDLGQQMFVSELPGFVLSRFHSLPYVFGRRVFLFEVLPANLRELVLAGPALLVALMQSRKYFRREVQNDIRSTIRYLAWPAMVMFAFTFFIQVPGIIAYQTGRNGEAVLIETYENIRNLQLDLTNTDETRPRILNPQEIARILPTGAKGWLQVTGIAAYNSSRFVYLNEAPSSLSWTTATLKLEDGSTCTVSDRFAVLARVRSARPSAYCERPDSKR